MYSNEHTLLSQTLPVKRVNKNIKLPFANGDAPFQEGAYVLENEQASYRQAAEYLLEHQVRQHYKELYLVGNAVRLAMTPIELELHEYANHLLHEKANTIYQTLEKKLLQKPRYRTDLRNVQLQQLTTVDKVMMVNTIKLLLKDILTSLNTVPILRLVSLAIKDVYKPQDEAYYITLDNAVLILHQQLRETNIPPHIYVPFALELADYINHNMMQITHDIYNKCKDKIKQLHISKKHFKIPASQKLMYRKKACEITQKRTQIENLSSFLLPSSCKLHSPYTKPKQQYKTEEQVLQLAKQCLYEDTHTTNGFLHKLANMLYPY